MYESFQSPEGSKSREEIVNALKTKGIEDAETKESLAQYIQERIDEVEKITDKKEHYRKRLEYAIEDSVMYYEAGYAQEAYDGLLETLETAYQAHEEDLIEKINNLLDDIEPKLTS